MACRLDGTKPLSEPLLECCWLDPWQQTSVQFSSEFKHFHWRKFIWKCRLRNGAHLSLPQCVKGPSRDLCGQGKYKNVSSPTVYRKIDAVNYSYCIKGLIPNIKMLYSVMPYICQCLHFLYHCSGYVCFKISFECMVSLFSCCCANADYDVIEWYHIFKSPYLVTDCLWPLLLTWFNFNPIMDK